MMNLVHTNLDALAAQINAEHQAVEAALHTALERAINAGNLLLQAKELCPHGAWLPWLEANFTGSVRTAQAYMRVAQHYSLDDPNTQRVAHLSFREALKALAEPTEKEPAVSTNGRELRTLMGEADICFARAVGGMLAGKPVDTDNFLDLGFVLLRLLDNYGVRYLPESLTEHAFAELWTLLYAGYLDGVYAELAEAGFDLDGLRSLDIDDLDLDPETRAVVDRLHRVLAGKHLRRQPPVAETATADPLPFDRLEDVLYDSNLDMTPAERARWLRDMAATHCADRPLYRTRLELAAELYEVAPGIRLTPAGMELPEDLPQADWLRVGEILAAMQPPVVAAAS